MHGQNPHDGSATNETASAPDARQAHQQVEAVLNDASADGTKIELRQFSLSAGGRELLHDTSVDIEPGRVTLLLGCSGVGKSLLLKILSGLITSDHSAVQFSGSVRYVAGDGSVRGIPDAGHPVAVVFQNFALLDELTPLQNVQIAIDHAGTVPAGERQKRAVELLAELKVPTDRPTGVLSGGQRQRLAIARAVSMQTDVILYDEPTSGLDVRTAVQVAELIHQTQQDHHRTSVIVTHDHESLLQIADRIILLDHSQKQLREVPPAEWNRLSEVLGDPPSAGELSNIAAKRSVMSTVLGRVSEWLSASGRSCEEVLLLPWSLLPLWRSFVWGLRFSRHYLVLVAGWSACIYIAVSGMIIGFVAQDFIFRYLPFRQFTEPLLTENLLHATGFSLYRFLVPILSTILIAARSGAAVAADVGSKVYGNQIDAMKTIGMNPERSLRTPVLYAFLIGTPILSLLSYLVASATASFAFLLTHADLGIAFWDAHFHRYLLQPQSVIYRGTGWLMIKLLTCGIGIGMISWRCGIQPKDSGPAISHGVTRTILWSTLYVLFVHFVFSLMEFTAQQ